MKTIQPEASPLPEGLCETSHSLRSQVVDPDGEPIAGWGELRILPYGFGFSASGRAYSLRGPIGGYFLFKVRAEIGPERLSLLGDPRLAGFRRDLAAGVTREQPELKAAVRRDLNRLRLLVQLKVSGISFRVGHRRELLISGLTAKHAQSIGRRALSLGAQVFTRSSS